MTYEQAMKKAAQGYHVREEDMNERWWITVKDGDDPGLLTQQSTTGAEIAGWTSTAEQRANKRWRIA